MNENDKHFIKRYEELLDKGYCDCNEMNCIDNNSPRRILNIVNGLQSKIEKVNQYLEERFIFDDENGEYYQTHTFDKDNAKELHDILKENK